MSAFDGMESPLGEVGEVCKETGNPGAADALDKATQGIQDALDENAEIPTPTTRFLYGPPDTSLDETLTPDPGDYVTQAGMLLDKFAPTGGYGTLGAAILNTQADLEHLHEQPLWLVQELRSDEGLSRLWRCELLLMQPLQEMIPEPVFNDPIKAWEQSMDFDRTSSDGAFGGGEPPFIMQPDPVTGIPKPVPNPNYNPNIAKDAQDAYNGTKDLASLLADPTNSVDDFSNAQDPDALWWDKLPNPSLDSPGPHRIANPTDYLGNFCRVSINRRFPANHFTLTERWMSGIGVEMEDLGVGADNWHRMRLVIMPRLYLLSLRKRYRTWSKKNSIEITLAILDEHGIYADKGDWSMGERRLQPGGRDLGPLSLDGAASMLHGATDLVGGALGAIPGVGSAASDALGAVGGALDTPIEDWTPNRELCVQYGETDLEFIERILAEDGIVYFFEHGERREVFVLADDPRAAGKKTLTVRRTPLKAFTDASAAAGDLIEEKAWNLSVDRRMVPSTVTIRDHNYSVPLDPSENKAPGSVTGAVPGGLSSMASLGGLSSMASAAMSAGSEMADTPGTEDYAGDSATWFEYPGNLILAPKDDTSGLYDVYGGPQIAANRLEGMRANGAIIRGSSDCTELMSGYNVRVQGLGFDILHPNHYEGQEILITGLQHTILPGKPYTNTFEGVNTVLRPRPVLKPGPRISGMQTATVIDDSHSDDWKASASEVHTDDLRRVKLRFHWDDKQGSEEAPPESSWVRVAQPLAGDGYGALFTPRIGMEVLVGFTDGIPDRPVVVGTLYDGRFNSADHRFHPARPLHDNTQECGVDIDARQVESGFVTHSYALGDTSRGNRLRFNDHATEEEIELFAQYDLEEEIGKDHITSVLRNQENTIGNEQTEEVGGDMTLHVLATPKDAEDWSRKKHVVKDEKITVGKEGQNKHYAEIGGDESLEITGNRTRECAQLEMIKVNGKVKDAAADAGASGTTPPASGAPAEPAATPAPDAAADKDKPIRELTVAGDNKVTLDGNDNLDVTGDREVRVAGAYKIEAKEVDLQTLSGGTAPGTGEPTGEIKVTPEGVSIKSNSTIHITGKDIAIKSDNDRVLVTAPEKVIVKCGDATITLDGKAETIEIHASQTLRLGNDTNYLELEQSKITLCAGDMKIEGDATTDEAKCTISGSGKLALSFQEGEIHFNGETVDVNSSNVTHRDSAAAKPAEPASEPKKAA